MSKISEFLASLMQQGNGQQQQPNPFQKKEEPSLPHLDQKNTTENPQEILDKLGALWLNKQDETKALDLKELLSEENIDKLVGTQNYISAIPPELLTKINGGDISSLVSLMNHIGQQAYKSAILHSTSITDAVSQSQLSNLQGKTQQTVSDLLKRNKMREQEQIPDNALIDDLFSTITGKLRTAKPDASEEDLHSLAKEVLGLAYNTLNPQPNSQKAPVMNYEAMLDGSASA